MKGYVLSSTSTVAEVVDPTTVLGARKAIAGFMNGVEELVVVVVVVVLVVLEEFSTQQVGGGIRSLKLTVVVVVGVGEGVVVVVVVVGKGREDIGAVLVYFLVSYGSTYCKLLRLTAATDPAVAEAG